VDLVMRHQHRAGDKLFVDYAGHTIPIYPPDAQVWQAQVFVAVLDASNYTFAEASASQGLECWIGSHVRCLEAMGAVPALLVPENVPRNIFRVLWPALFCGPGSTAPFAMVVNGAVGLFLAT
jgi:transposase